MRQKRPKIWCFAGKTPRTKVCVLEHVYYTTVKLAKGKNNFFCEVKDDFVRNGTYKCGLCVSNNINECYHTTADYGSNLEVARKIFRTQRYK